MGDPAPHPASVYEPVGWPAKDCESPCGQARISVSVHTKDHASNIGGDLHFCRLSVHCGVVGGIRVSWFRFRGILRRLCGLRILRFHRYGSLIGWVRYGTSISGTPRANNYIRSWTSVFSCSCLEREHYPRHRWAHWGGFGCWAVRPSGTSRLTRIRAGRRRCPRRALIYYSIYYHI